MKQSIDKIGFISILVLQICFIALSEKLPDYIEPCAQNDPNIDECFVNKSQTVIPELIKGVDYLKIPVLSPLLLKDIELIDTANLKLRFHNLTAKGLETGNVLNAKVDLTNRTIATDVHFDQIEFEGTYFVDGKILILPIQGSGTAKIIFDDVIIHFFTGYELRTKNDTEYMHLIDSKLSYELKHASYRLNDLFKGDKFLGEETNKFLNQNWEALHQEFSVVISRTVKRTVLKILERIVDVIPFNEIFIPE